MGKKKLYFYFINLLYICVNISIYMFFYLCLIIYHFICFFKIEFMNRWIKTFKAKVQLILYLLMRIMQLWKGSYTKVCFFYRMINNLFILYIFLYDSRPIRYRTLCPVLPKTIPGQKPWAEPKDGMLMWKTCSDSNRQDTGMSLNTYKSNMELW